MTAKGYSLTLHKVKYTTDEFVQKVRAVSWQVHLKAHSIVQSSGRCSWLRVSWFSTVLLADCHDSTMR